MFYRVVLCLSLSFMLLGACVSRPSPAVSPSAPPVSTDTPAQTASPTVTPVPPTVTPTPIPPAALVNGELIPLAAYQAHLARFQAAWAEAGTDMATEEAARIVLDDLISQVLLAQSAAASGFDVDQALMDERLAALLAEIGGEQALADWQAEQGYTPEIFEKDLALAIAAAWMRDQVIAAVPEAAEQVHARQILLYNSEDAQDIHDQLESGADFGRLALGFDPQRRGDLGWFPRGFLIESAVEAAAFSLEVGEYSPVIETRLGYHIIQVLEKDPARPLDPQARLALQRAELEAWLDDNRRASDIEIFVEEYR